MSRNPEIEMSESSGVCPSPVMMSGVDPKKRCECGLRAPLKASWTDANPGRCFFGCASYGKMKTCGFFEWFDPCTCPRDMEVGRYLTKKIKLLECEVGVLKHTVTRLKFWMGVSWVATVIMGVLLLRSST